MVCFVRYIESRQHCTGLARLWQRLCFGREACYYCGVKLLFATIVCALFAFGGLSMMAQSRELPVYYNPAQYRMEARALNEAAVMAMGNNAQLPAFDRTFHQLRQRHLTERFIMFDRGLALLALAASAWSIAALLWLADRRVITGYLTPQRGSILALFSIGLFGLFAAPLGNLLRTARGDFPWWSDHVSFLIFTAAIGYIVAVGPLTIAVIIALRRYRPGIPLLGRLRRPLARPYRPFIAACLASLVLAWVGVYCFVAGQFELVLPVVYGAAVTVFLFAGLRASPHRKPDSARAHDRSST